MGIRKVNKLKSALCFHGSLGKWWCNIFSNVFPPQRNFSAKKKLNYLFYKAINNILETHNTKAIVSSLSIQIEWPYMYIRSHIYIYISIYDVFIYYNL